MPKFKAYRTFEENGVVSSHFTDMTVDELDHGVEHAADRRGLRSQAHDPTLALTLTEQVER